MQTVREKIRQQTERTRLRVDLGELVGTLTRIIRGWRAYFAIGNSTKKLADLDRYVWLRLSGLLDEAAGLTRSAVSDGVCGVGATERLGLLLSHGTTWSSASHVVG